jgi:putative ABC transport system permease protein
MTLQQEDSRAAWGWRADSDRRGARVVGALVAIRALQAMLYEVKPGDPSTMLAVVAGFAAAALVACYLPALRAAQIDPSKALRTE